SVSWAVVTRTIIAVVLTLVAGVGSAGAQGARPPSPPPAGRAPAPEARQFELLGVVIGGDVRKALIREPALTGGSEIWLTLGARLGEYTLRSIEDDEVRFDADAGSVTVRLGGSRGPSVTSSPTRQGAPAAPTPETPSVRQARQRLTFAYFLALRTGMA